MFAAGMQMTAGTYTRRASPLSVTGLGFQPDVVMVEADLGQNIVIETA